MWQDPTDRRFVKVGQLDALPNARYAFHYLPAAAAETNFTPLVEYPRLDALYVSNEIPAFFANRVLSSDRPHYAQYLGWLGIAHLDESEIPVEVLARTGGGRATDTFHVVDLPQDGNDTFSSRFFVSGIRYADQDGVAVASLRNGAVLSLRLETDNLKNPNAVLINTDDGRKIGYVPDWLCADVHERIRSGWSVTAVAERVNPDAPAHVRVLCRVTASRC